VVKVFIDGQAGATGLKLYQRISGRPDLELIHIDEALRKDAGARLACIAEADVTFLCLPDDGAVEIVSLIEKENGPDSGFSHCHVIDCSTAHRTSPDWVYGLPELARGRGADGGNAYIGETGKRIANPGCYATGFIMSVRPLIDAGLIAPEAMICFHALTGYSGGGKAMIEQYEAGRTDAGEGDRKRKTRAPRQYALGQQHKHLPEMRKYSGLETVPVFSPIVCDFYCGMLVSVPLPRSTLRSGVPAEAVRETLAARYAGCPLVKVREAGEEFSEAAGGGYLSADAFAGRDDIEIFVTGKDDRIEIVSRYDNLGKGASGAAIQNMNILLGLPEETGLVLGA